MSDEPVVDEQGRRLDRVALTGIGATGHHGVHQFERDEGQPFLADVVLHLDTRRAAAGDDLARTVDYGVVARRVHAVLAGEPVALIETVAERIAATVLADPGVHTVDVTVHKPQAPVEVPFEDVSVSIRRDRAKLPAAEPYREADATIGLAPDEPGVAAPDDEDAVDGEIVLDQLDERPGAPVDVVLAMGGNLGPVAETLRTAVHELTQVSGLEVTAVSPLARTAAVGGPDQPDFLNAVVLARTTLAPREVLRACQGIENAHGRQRSVHWGPRTLDIDVIVYGSVLAVTDDLELPHPRAHQRAFVLQPWAQADPEAVLPGLGGGPFAALAETAPDRDGVRWLALDWLTDPIPTTGATPAGGRGGGHVAGHTVRLTPAVPVRSATSVRTASASASAAPGMPVVPGMSAMPPAPGMPVVPPAPGMSVMPPAPGMSVVPPAPGMSVVPPAPGMPVVPPAPGMPGLSPAPGMSVLPPAPAAPVVPPALGTSAPPPAPGMSVLPPLPAMPEVPPSSVTSVPPATPASSAVPTPSASAIPTSPAMPASPGGQVPLWSPVIPAVPATPVAPATGAPASLGAQPEPWLPAVPTAPQTTATTGGWTEPWSPTDPAGTAGRVEPWTPADVAPAGPTGELAPWPPVDTPAPLRPASPLEPWSPPDAQAPADSEAPADPAAPASPEGSTGPAAPPSSPARPVGPTGTAATPVVAPWEP